MEYAKNYAEGLASDLSNRFSLRYGWQGNTLNVKGSGVTGSLRLSEQEILVELDLGLMVRPFKGALAKDIESRLDAFVNSVES